MKTKIFLGLLCCILLVSLIGMTQAQSTGAGTWLDEVTRWIMVRFAEDPWGEHGKQIVSYSDTTHPSEYVLVDTVPANKRLIITDIMMVDPTETHLAISSGGDGTQVVPPQLHIGLHSGLVFNQDESIWVYTPGTSTYVTVTGYFVDLP